MQLGAERILVLQGPEPLKLKAAFGIKEEMPWTDQVSLGLLQQSLTNGECLLLGDAQSSAMADRWSVAVSEIRSVLCVPFWSPSSRIVGILYADTLSRAGAFTRKAMETMQACARNLERSLYGASQASPPPEKPAPVPTPVAASGTLGLRKVAAARPVTAPAPIQATSARVDGRAMTVFYRSLATMVSAGLPITRSLDILAHHTDNKALRAITHQVATRVSSGSTVSAAMALHPQAFGRFETRLVRLAEKTGSLHCILDNLATHREKSHTVALQIKSALTYPAIILVFCLCLLILGPPYLLEGQFRLIRESHQPIPWITAVIMHFSDFVRSPLGWVFLLSGALAGAAGLRAFCNKERLHALAQRTPGLGRALKNLATARFARSLALTYRIGLPITEGLLLAAQNADNPQLEAAIPRAVEALIHGSGLAGSLESIDFFPPLMIHSLRASEESGNVDGMLDWTARLYEVQLESSLQSFLALIEPLLMMGMGILVGIVLLATLLPMANMLQSL